MCRGKALQWAALPLLCLAIVTPYVHAAAVHRALGVDAATARLLGQEPLRGPVSFSSEKSSDPAAFFAPDSWRPVSSTWRELSPGSNFGSSEVITKDLLTGSRQIWPQPRSGETLEIVITPKPIRVPDPVEPKANARGPEVEDSIAAVASQLLGSGQDAVVLDVRTPPLMTKHKQQMEAVGSATPIKLKEDEAGTWSLISTQLNEKLVITKVPEISKTTTMQPSKLSSTISESVPTRFPPRKPPTPPAVKTPMVEISMQNPSTDTPIIETTSKKTPVITSAPSKAPVVITKKPTPSAPGQSSKPAPIALTVLKRNSTVVLTTKAPTTIAPVKTTTPTQKLPIMSFTEKIPTSQNRKPQTPLVMKSTTTVPPVTKASTTTSVPKPEKVNDQVFTALTKPSVSPKPEKAPLIAIKSPDAHLPTKLITERPQPIDFEKISFSKPSTFASQLKLAQTSSPAPVTEPQMVAVMTAAPSAISTTTKRPRRKSNKKKNKNRRRRPSKPTPSETIENKQGEESITDIIKPNKPLSTRIYNFISRDVMPNFGVGVVGLLVTAGLAGLLLLPIDSFARRNEVNRREEEQDSILPSIIQAVMTSLNIGEKKYKEEQGPRRLRRQVYNRHQAYNTHNRRHVYNTYNRRQEYNEINSNDAVTPVPAPDEPSFSFLRFVKQLLAVKLDVMSNMLRVASEALRNYAQHANQRPQIGTSTMESATEKVELLEPSTHDMTTATTTTTTTEVVADTASSEDSEEANLVRRRTTL